MPAETTYTGLTVDAVRDEEQGVYLFVVNLDGAQVTIGADKVGRVDSLIERAQLEAENTSGTSKRKSSGKS